MQLTRTGTDQAEIARPTAPGAHVLIGGACALLSLLPWLGPGPGTPARTLTSAAFAGVAAFLTRRLWSRSPRIRISVSDGQIEAPSRTYPLSDLTELRLETSSEVDEAPIEAYRVTAGLRGGASLLLFFGTDPAEVLRDLRALLQLLPSVPVRSGWGLAPRDRPWLESQAPVLGAASGRSLSASPIPGQRRIAWTLGIGGALVGMIQTWLLWSRTRVGLESAALSVVLPMLLSGSVLVVAAAIGTGRVVFDDSEPLRARRAALGRTLRTWSSPRAEVRGVWAVSPGRDEARHLVFALGEDLVSVPCAGDDAARALALFQARTVNES